MKIPAAADIREWDQYTIRHEPVASIDLMERAAESCVKWINKNLPGCDNFHIFCGKGNNGGDGLAIARLLTQQGHHVAVYILEFGHLGTDDFQQNLSRLHQFPQSEIRFIQSKENFPDINNSDVIIDALIGSGLNRKLDSVTADLVSHLNEQRALRIAIDIPSGMFVDSSSLNNVIIEANHTLSFQTYKPAFLVAENAAHLGKVHILDIGLHRDFYDTLETDFELTDEDDIANIYKPRNNFSHKGDHGHALLLAGSYGKTGAAVLAAKACLRSGVGLLTCHVPASSYSIMQMSVPEAMTSTDYNTSFLTRYEDDYNRFDAIGIGPGIGTAIETKQLLAQLPGSNNHKLVLDADALNIIAANKDLLSTLPPGTILTPHPKEFERLFGKTANEFERIKLAKEKSLYYNITIVLKGHHTVIASPDRKIIFNSTGNAGMATGGSGDVLTGILTALLAQGYSSADTAILGVYIHGLAGDMAAEKLSMPAMIAGDIVDNLPAAFLQLEMIRKNGWNP